MKFIKRNFLLIIIIVIILILISSLWPKLSSNDLTKKTDEKLKSVVSFYPLYFFTSRIGGDKADVYSITPASAEPHDYEPTTQDIARIFDSNLLVLNGSGFEPWADRIKNQLEGGNVIVVSVSEGLANKRINDDGRNETDLHIWLDPVLAKNQVEKIKKGFDQIDQTNSAFFEANAKKIEDELDQIHNEYKQDLSNCQKKTFVTAHSSFGYLASRYGLRQISISGLSPDAEPSAQKLAEIADIIKKEKIKIVFFESLVSPKLSQMIAQETGAQTMALNPIEGLTQEELSSGKNYITVMRENLSALQIALECTK